MHLSLLTIAAEVVIWFPDYFSPGRQKEYEYITSALNTLAVPAEAWSVPARLCVAVM